MVARAKPHGWANHDNEWLIRHVPRRCNDDVADSYRAQGGLRSGNPVLVRHVEVAHDGIRELTRQLFRCGVPCGVAAEKHTPGVGFCCLVDGRDVEVEECGLKEVGVVQAAYFERGPRPHALAEDVFDAIEETLFAMFGDRRGLELLGRQRGGQLLEQLLLLARQLLGCDDRGRDEEVAAPAAADVGHAAAAQAERGAGPRPFGYLERLLAFERGNPDLSAECDRCEVQCHLAVEIVALPLKVRMFLNVNNDVEVPGSAARRPCLSFAGEAETLAGGDPCRDLDCELAFFLDATRPTARGARLVDDRARSAAGTARARKRERPLLQPDLSAPLALRTRRGLRAWRGPVSVTGRTWFLPGNLNGGFGPFGGLVERDFEVVSQVGAPLRSSPSRASKDVAEPEHVAEAAEDVLEATEYGGIESPGCGRTKPRVAEAVVHVALVAVGQHRVGFGGFLEFLFGFLAS